MGLEYGLRRGAFSTFFYFYEGKCALLEKFIFCSFIGVFFLKTYFDVTFICRYASRHI